MTAPFIFADDPFTAVKLQLGEAAGDHEFGFAAAVNVSPSLGRWFAKGTDTGSAACFKQEGGREGERDEPIGSQLLVRHQATASFRLQPGRKGTSASC